MAKVIDFPAITYRVMDDADLQQVADFLYQHWHEMYRDILPESFLQSRTKEYFIQSLQRLQSEAWLALVDDTVIGFASSVSNCVDDLWVAKRYRRKGIGSHLLSLICEKLVNKDMQSVQVGCETGNSAALEFFNYHDWQVLHRADEPIGAGWSINMTVLTARLSQNSTSQNNTKGEYVV